MWLKRLTLEEEIVKNPSMSLSSTLIKNDKVEHCIRIKTHKSITLKFWIENSISDLYGRAHVTPSMILTKPYIDATTLDQKYKL